jgi:hypothetical protein
MFRHTSIDKIGDVPTRRQVIPDLAFWVPLGHGQEALQHLMNYVWPNVFENSPHLIMAARLKGCRASRDKKNSN